MAIAAALVRRTEIAVLFLAVLAILLIAPGAISAETGSEGATEEPVWSADMLVVEYTSVSIGAASAALFSNIGGSRDPKIKSLWSHVPSRDIRLAFQEGISDADDLTLIVGELTLEFPPGSSGNSSFKWTDVDADWEDGETIQVRIVQTSALEEQEETTDNTPATGEPTISGTAQVDETLTAETSNIADDDGLDGVSFSYQWIRSDNGADTDIAGETDSTYTLVLADQGKTIKVKVTFTDDAENEETLTSVATVPVAAASNREATGAPTISGIPQVNQTLTADTSAIADEDGLDDVSYSYQWISGGSDIDGATGSSYTLTASEQGQTIQARVTFTDDAGNDETLTSAPVDPVQAGESAPGAPIRLTSRWNVPGEDKGIVLEWRAPPGTVAGYRILRIEGPVTVAFAIGEPLPHGCTVEFVVHVDDTGSDATTYTDTDVAEGAEYGYRVKAINSDGVGPQSQATSRQYRPHGWWPSGVPGTPLPTGNLVSTRVNDGVELTWDAVNDGIELTVLNQSQGEMRIRRIPGHGD